MTFVNWSADVFSVEIERKPSTVSSMVNIQELITFLCIWTIQTRHEEYKDIQDKIENSFSAIVGDKIAVLIHATMPWATSP